jgi:AcrR family transcriptional regulator
MVSDRRSANDAPPPAPARARSAPDKEARRAVLLAAAWALFREADYDAITVASVAAKAGLAKGTVYLYVRTKEELFLELAVERLGEWIDDVDARLDAARSPTSATLARAFCESLRPRADLLRLVVILHSILERNVEEPPIVRFKRAILARVAATGDRLERHAPWLRAGDGGRVLLRIYALMIGLWQLSEPGPIVARVLAAPELAPLRLDFQRELHDTIAAILAGMERKGGRR